MSEEEFLWAASTESASPLRQYDHDTIQWIYWYILRHIISGIDPRTTTKDIIYSLNKRLEELEESNG